MLFNINILNDEWIIVDLRLSVRRVSHDGMKRLVDTYKSEIKDDDMIENSVIRIQSECTRANIDGGREGGAGTGGASPHTVKDVSR